MSSLELGTTPNTFGTTQFAIDEFIKHLHKSKRVLALCGAGLSAPSGIPTFKGSGAMWKNHKAATLSSIDAFEANPGLVWKYFADRRRLALRAKPNRGHVALADCTRKKGKGMKVLTQNIDGLSQRAKHPLDQLEELHGSLMHVKCSNNDCEYIDKNNFTDPLCPALASDEAELDSFSSQPKSTNFDLSAKLSSLTISNDKANAKNLEEEKYPKFSNPLMDIINAMSPTITPEMREIVIEESKLPHCPRCSSLLRPGVVWFGESLDQTQFDKINAWIDEEKKLDLMIVIGTQAEVFPAARFVHKAREKGARIAIVNMDGNHIGGLTLRGKDWIFEGSADEILPVLFEGVLLN